MDIIGNGGLQLTFEGASNLIQSVIVPSVIQRLTAKAGLSKKYDHDIFNSDIIDMEDKLLIEVHVVSRSEQRPDLRYVVQIPYNFRFKDEKQVQEWAVEIGQKLYDGMKAAMKQKLSKKGTIH